MSWCWDCGGEGGDGGVGLGVFLDLILVAGQS